MIESNNADIDVDALMQRVRDEVAAMRALATSHDEVQSVLGEGGRLPEIVGDLSRHAVINELIEDAARMSRPRSAIPARLERAPFGMFRPAVRFALRVLSYALKDQRHVNAATQQALREMLRLIVAIGNHVAKLNRFTRDHANTVRDLASLGARVTAAEERSTEFFERLGGYATLESRVAAAEERSGAYPRLDARSSALENAMTTNAERIDVVETESAALSARARALEDAMTLTAARIDGVQVPVEARLLALESAQTIAAQRLGHLESFRDEAHILSALLQETRRELSAERERALRAEASLRSEMTAQLNAVSALMRSAPLATAPGDVAPTAAPVDETRYGELHLAIADRFRGDNESIREQLAHYLGVVRESATIDEEHPLVDVGSGRGEWLLTLAQAELPAFGIDLNPTLAARAVAEGLRVVEGDALEVLRARPASSLGALTAFHVIEHLTFEQMIALFDESLRTLVPGGTLICETPNPANVTIGACNFYLDPTHRHPLPAPLVSYLVELRGFTDIRLVDLAPNDAMLIDEDTEAARRINAFFYGAQNYAVIARKPGALR
jgi:O-antigen chain-terminating methyltransferase